MLQVCVVRTIEEVACSSDSIGEICSEISCDDVKIVWDVMMI